MAERSDHPGDEALADYAAGETERAEGRRLERHLAGCLACQRRLDALAPASGRTVRWQAYRFASGLREVAADEVAEPERAERGRRLLSAFGSALGNLQLRRVDELLAEPQHRRRRLLRDESERYGGLNLRELLEERCRAAWRSDPADAVELAKLAVLVAAEADPELYGSRRVSSARELALLHLGISFRLAAIAGRAAEEAERAGASEPAPVPVAEIEAALEEVRGAFLERRMWFDVACVALDQMRLLHALDRAEEMAELSDRAAVALRAAGAPEEAEEPVRAIGREHRRGRVDADLFERIDRAVQERRNDPRMRFEPEEPR